MFNIHICFRRRNLSYVPKVSITSEISETVWRENICKRPFIHPWIRGHIKLETLLHHFCHVDVDNQHLISWHPEYCSRCHLPKQLKLKGEASQVFACCSPVTAARLVTAAAPEQQAAVCLLQHRLESANIVVSHVEQFKHAALSVCQQSETVKEWIVRQDIHIKDRCLILAKMYNRNRHQHFT